MTYQRFDSLAQFIGLACLSITCGCTAAAPWQLTPRTAPIPSSAGAMGDPARAQRPEQPAASAVIRGQDGPGYGPGYRPQPAPGGSDQHLRYPMPVSGGAPQGNGGTVPAGDGTLPPPNGVEAGGVAPATAQGPFLGGPGNWGQPIGPDVNRTVPLDVFVEEARTGRFMFGVGVNSDAGVTGQVIIDERNFDITRIPTSFDEILNGTAFRGAGQGFRVEAVPGDLVQRYLMSFTEPYLFSTPISLNVSGFLFDRRYRDWDEQRLGGRLGFGYRLTPDLSVSLALRAEEVDVHDPRVRGVPELEAVLGESEIFSGRVTLSHDTRDIPFAPTQGHLIELSYEQVFGSFDYPRGEIDYRRYFLIRERPDGSGRHTLAFAAQVGFSGAQTPVFENFFAGGFSTIRGFDFRGASPVSGGVIVGGEFQFLGSVEYTFPLTADDMIKGVAFLDYGTVEETTRINSSDFRVAPGLGLRISIPALGPAPLALDFAIPINHEATDDIQNFSFFFGFGRI